MDGPFLEMVILLSCTELSSLWETSKILHSGHLSCNFSVKGDMLTSSVALCKARHDVPVLVPSKQRGKLFPRNLWIKSHTRMPLGSMFGSWLVERSIPIRLFIPARTRVKCRWECYCEVLEQQFFHPKAGL